MSSASWSDSQVKFSLRGRRQKGEGRREIARAPPDFPSPFPFLAPATQAKGLSSIAVERNLLNWLSYLSCRKQRVIIEGMHPSLN